MALPPHVWIATRKPIGEREESRAMGTNFAIVPKNSSKCGEDSVKRTRRAWSSTEAYQASKGNNWLTMARRRFGEK